MIKLALCIFSIRGLSIAARRWQVGAADIVVRDGVVSHPASGRKASFGELAADEDLSRYVL